MPTLNLYFYGLLRFTSRIGYDLNPRDHSLNLNGDTARGQFSIQAQAKALVANVKAELEELEKNLEFAHSL